MANFDTLKAQIAAKIHDNTEQEITAQDVRDCFDDTIDAINAAKEDEGAIAPAQWGGITGDLDDQTDLKNALAAKQDTISDLATIQSGAAAGATAVQPGDLATVASTGDYDDLLNKPTIPAAQVQADWNEADNTKADYIKNKPTIPAAQVNSDWNANSGVAQILNKPTIPSAPGTLDTTATTAQATNASEALSGSVVLHKISKTGKYSDLSGKPTVPVITLNGSTAGNPSFYAPTGAGTVGQVLTSNGSGAPTWQNAPSGGVQDVTVGGTSVVSGGVAAVPAIPAAPGTLDTDNAAAQSVNSSEALSGAIKLHKVSKTGSYNDLLNKPSIPTVPTISTDIDTDRTSDTKTASPKAVYDFVCPPKASSQPQGGMAPGIFYDLGTLTGSVTISLAAPSDASIANEYRFTFVAGSTAPTITWPAGVEWAGGCVESGAPVITGGNSYEVSIMDGKGIIVEWEA